MPNFVAFSGQDKFTSSRPLFSGAQFYFKIYDFKAWLTNINNTDIAQYLTK